MKLIVLRNNLKNGLDTAGRAIGSNLNLPVLGNILIKTDVGGIFVSATNLECAITKKIPGKVMEEGSITVPYNTLSSIVNNSTSERISIEVRDKNLYLETDNYKATIQGIAEEEFPIIPLIQEGPEHLELEAGVLRDKLQKVVIAAGVSDLRPEISGVLFVIEPTVMKLVATDSFRLAEATIGGTQFKNTLEQGVRCIVPLKPAQELVKIFSDDEKVRIFIEKNQILFKGETATMISRLIDGNFPDYEAIIPKTVAVDILAKREDLINALRVMSAFAGRANEIKVEVKDEKTIELYARDSALGENKYLLPATISGDATTLTFNGKYLFDGIRAESGEDIYIGLNGDTKPSVIRAPKAFSYFYIVMPIKQ